MSTTDDLRNALRQYAQYVIGRKPDEGAIEGLVGRVKVWLEARFGFAVSEAMDILHRPPNQVYKDLSSITTPYRPLFQRAVKPKESRFDWGSVYLPLKRVTGQTYVVYLWEDQFFHVTAPSNDSKTLQLTNLATRWLEDTVFSPNRSAPVFEVKALLADVRNKHEDRLQSDAWLVPTETGAVLARDFAKGTKPNGACVPMDGFRCLSYFFRTDPIQQFWSDTNWAIVGPGRAVVIFHDG